MKKFLIAAPLALLASVHSKTVGVGKVTVPRGKYTGETTYLSTSLDCGNNEVSTSLKSNEAETGILSTVEDDWFFTKVEGTSD